ncbi:hypothetical protein MPSEU_001007100 [Mayamaea pseudoterrestris]|nr:hypothetical protein MPSEU_001007100 [Mayamaea pseudoterrestris]
MADGRWQSKVEGANLCALFDRNEADPHKIDDVLYIHNIYRLHQRLFGQVKKRNWLNNYRRTAQEYLANKQAQGGRRQPLPPPVLPPGHLQPSAPDESEDESYTLASDPTEELMPFEEIDSQEINSILGSTIMSHYKPSHKQAACTNGTFYKLICGPFTNEKGDEEMTVRLLANSGIEPKHIQVQLSKDHRSLLVLQRVPNEFFDAQRVADESFGPCALSSAETAAFQRAVQQVRATNKESVYVGSSDYIDLGRKVEPLAEGAVEIVVLPTNNGSTFRCIKVRLQLPRTGYKTPRAPTVRVVQPYNQPLPPPVQGDEVARAAPRGVGFAIEQVLNLAAAAFILALSIYFAFLGSSGWLRLL